jgi:hypothetical protein
VRLGLPGIAIQLAPPSVLFTTPVSVPAYKRLESWGSTMTESKLVEEDGNRISQLAPPSVVFQSAPPLPRYPVVAA